MANKIFVSNNDLSMCNLFTTAGNILAFDHVQLLEKKKKHWLT